MIWIILVINYDFQTKKYIDLPEVKAIKNDYEAFKYKLMRALQHEEWSRCEYEIMVGSLFAKDESEYIKIDCYQQAEPNIKIIAKYVLEEYYPRLKINLETEEYGKDRV